MAVHELERFRANVRAVFVALAVALLPTCKPSSAGKINLSCDCGVSVTKFQHRDGSSPGLSTRQFPGLDRLAPWMRESPFVWVTYYLPAPCYADTSSWSGQRRNLISQGWGLAVVFVGQQAPGVSLRFADVPAAAEGGATARTCTRNTLTAAQGTADADAAMSSALQDSFPKQTKIYLDVGRTTPYSPALDTYVRSWVKEILAQNNFVPGIYGDDINASTLFTAQQEEFRKASSSMVPPFWVVSSRDFAVTKTPAASGFSFATIWQNPTDAGERHGGVALVIERNVATADDPSRP